MSSPEYTATPNSDPKRSQPKDLEATLPHFFSRFTEDSYDDNDKLSQATSAFQRSIVSYLKSGKSYEDLLKYITKECDDAKTAYEEQVAKEKKAAAEAEAKAKSLSGRRKIFVQSLMNYLYDLGMIEKKDISDENREKMNEILKEVEKGLSRENKIKFDPFSFNFGFDIDSPVGRRRLLRLWEDLCDF